MRVYYQIKLCTHARECMIELSNASHFFTPLLHILNFTDQRISIKTNKQIQVNMNVENTEIYYCWLLYSILYLSVNEFQKTNV